MSLVEKLPQKDEERQERKMGTRPFPVGNISYISVSG